INRIGSIENTFSGGCDGDFGAFVIKLPRDGKPNSSRAARTGHNCGLPFESHCRGSPVASKESFCQRVAVSPTPVGTVFSGTTPLGPNYPARMTQFRV